MKIQFAILWLLLLICLPAFETIGQSTQPIELLKPKELLTNNDNDITNSYRDLGKEWSLTQKTNDRGDDKQTLFHRIRNKTKKNNSNSDNGQLFSNSEYEIGYVEIPIGLMRTFTSRGDYGNLYFFGLSMGMISGKFDFTLTFFTLGWGRTAKDVQYYTETWNPESKTYGFSAVIFDAGYNISPIKDIRFSPMIGFTVESVFGPKLKDIDKYSGLEKYVLAELLIPQVGFDTYYFKSYRPLLRLKYRYIKFSVKNNIFFEDVSINKHRITLGINLFNGDASKSTIIRI